jgi:hypothetical protein
MVGFEAKLMAQGGLDAFAIEQLAFDLGCFERFAGHHVDQNGRAIVLADMFDRADLLARVLKEARFERRKRRLVPAEARPIRVLPIPAHEL